MNDSVKLVVYLAFIPTFKNSHFLTTVGNEALLWSIADALSGSERIKYFWVLSGCVMLTQMNVILKISELLAEFKDDHDGSSSDMSEYDWEENSDDDLGSPTKMPGTRPSAPAARPTAASKPPSRPTAKPPARPSKPPAIPSKPPTRPPRPSKPPTRRKDPEIEAIMEAMDRELAQTEVGKSFEREPPRVLFYLFVLLLF